VTLTKAIETARARVTRDGRKTYIYQPHMRLWHEVQHPTAAYARGYARGALIATALDALGIPSMVRARVINRAPDTGRWTDVVRAAAASLDDHCPDILSSPREDATRDLHAMAAAGSQLAAQWLAETDGMAWHEWRDWLESEPV